MTFDAFESSADTGQPIEVFLFTQESTGVTYAYTNAEDAQTVDGVDYTPAAISRSKIANTSEDRGASLEIQVPGNNPLASLWLTVAPAGRFSLVIKRIHRTDTQAIVLFRGQIASVGWTNNFHSATIVVTPDQIALSRTGPERDYGTVCSNMLYDGFCGVNKLDPAFSLQDAEITIVSDNQITVAGANAYADDWFNGGYVEFVGGSDARMILDHTGNVLRLLFGFPGSVVGAKVNVYAGCDHTFTTCVSKFTNGDNYGGFISIPNRNIFRTGLT